MSDDLFGILGEEATVRAPEPAEEPWGAADVKYTAFKGARRVCDHCIRAIHASKAGSAPLTAAFKRAGPNGDLFLCPVHKHDQQRRDARAQALRDARVDIVARAPKKTARKKPREHA
jgi:hypothetical protein